MTTLISATNRPGSMTLLVAQTYKKILDKKGYPVTLCNLEDLPVDALHSAMYGNPSTAFDVFQNKYLIPADKFLIIAPEYNGGFPGILKLMIDASDIPNAYHGKKVALTGVSSGRAGNLRGMEHLTGIFNYLQMQVMYNKLPISKIETLIDKEGFLADMETLKAIDKQCDQFIKF
ncbi:MAG: NAD(P)H-dependent oxidoreductase [Chitinophagales bacterium]